MYRKDPILERLQRGENIISLALAAVVFLAVVAIQRRWNPADLKDVASSAEDFILTTAGIRGQVPDIAGYERVKTFRIGRYRAGLYRASPAPLAFAPGRFVIYTRDDQPVFRLETLEGSKDAWTTLYDFAGRRGSSTAESRAKPAYTRSLTGKQDPDILIGQYSGGDQCCTTVTIVELGAESVRPLGHISGLDEMPFEGLEVRKIFKDATWELIAHRPYQTSCGAHEDAADVLAVYGYDGENYSDQTSHYRDYLSGVLRQEVAKWANPKSRSLQLLQTIAAHYAILGEQDQARRSFAMNLNDLMPALKQRGVDPNACIEGLESLMSKLPSAAP